MMVEDYLRIGLSHVIIANRGAITRHIYFLEKLLMSKVKDAMKVYFLPSYY